MTSALFARLKAYRDRLAAAEYARHEATRRAAEEAAYRSGEEADAHRAEAKRLAREGQSPEERGRAAQHLALAEAAVERAEAWAREASIDLEPVRIRGDYGAAAYVARAWTFEIIDLGQVPREYLSLDVEAVRVAIIKDGVREIPGLKMFQSESLRVRGAG